MAKAVQTQSKELRSLSIPKRCIQCGTELNDKPFGFTAKGTQATCSRRCDDAYYRSNAQKRRSK
jgi:hypothetical protein